MTAVLSKAEILELVGGKTPLVEGYVDLGEQVQANGIDLTLRDVSVLQSMGRIAESNRERLISDTTPLFFDAFGYIELMPGAYLIAYNEVVHLPKDVMALGRPRSSLLRCGVDVATAVWDAGYEGRSQSLLTVYNPCGFRVQKNARVMQLVFFRLERETEGYSGAYQGENM